MAEDQDFTVGSTQWEGRELKTLEHKDGPTILFARDRGLFVASYNFV